jgi:hypothetical protein
MTRSSFEEMLRTADAPAPEGPARVASAQRVKARREMHAPESNIQPGHRLIFNALTSGLSDEFALMSCFVNGKPTAMIVAAQQTNRGLEIMPLFVSLTEAMAITDHDGDILWDGGAR